MIRVVSALVAGCCLAFGACKAPVDTRTDVVKSLDEAFESDTLVIETDDGAQLQFDVYLATEPDQQRRGLMFVRNMPERTGMLFVYEDSAVRSMWMKNTYSSLDIVFARADGTISSIVREAEPLSLTSRTSTEPVTYVLELNAGITRRYNIGEKSRIVFDGGKPP